MNPYKKGLYLHGALQWCFITGTAGVHHKPGLGIRFDKETTNVCQIEELLAPVVPKHQGLWPFPFATLFPPGQAGPCQSHWPNLQPRQASHQLCTSLRIELCIGRETREELTMIEMPTINLSD